MTEKRFLTLTETAEYLSISLNQMYKLSHSGKLKGIKVAFGVGDKPRNIRVDREKLEQFIENQEAER